jgi:hypothetical protein
MMFSEKTCPIIGQTQNIGVIFLEQVWNDSMEACFSAWLDGPEYDKAQEALFQLARRAFAAGYQLGAASTAAEEAAEAGEH